MQNELSLKPKRRQKLKLTFDQLEKEMELEGSILSSPMELSAITGGSNIDEILQYYQSLGFIFTTGSDGNYYGAKNITLENVTVTAHRSNSGSSLYNSGNFYQYFWDNINQIGWAATITGGGGGGGGTTSQSPISSYSKQIFLTGGTLTLTTSEVPPIAVAIAALTTVAAGAAWLYENWGTLKTYGDPSKWSYTYEHPSQNPIHNQTPIMDPMQGPQGGRDIYGIITLLGLTTLQAIDQYNEFRSGLPPALRDTMPSGDTIFKYNSGSH